MADDAEEQAVALQLSFVKDTIYGAVTLVMFSSFGWQQWPLAALHVLSVPGALVHLSGARMLGFALTVTLLVTLTDVVAVLTFTCGIVKCCTGTNKAPAFAPTMHVCDPKLAGVQGQLVTITSIATVGVGAILSMARAIKIEVIAGGGGWLALAAAYVGLRIYQLTWLAQEWMTVAALAWAGSGVVVFSVAAADARRALRAKANRRHSSKTGMLLYAAAGCDVLLIFLPLVGGSVSTPLHTAFYAVQSIASVVAVWQAHRYFAMPVGEEETTGGDTEKDAIIGAGTASEKLRFRQNNRNLCL